MVKKSSDIHNTRNNSGCKSDTTQDSGFRSGLLALESRILFDGAAVGTAVAADALTVDAASGDPVHHFEALEQAGNALFDALSLDRGQVQSAQEIAFVDTNVENYQDILSAIGDNVNSPAFPRHRAVSVLAAFQTQRVAATRYLRVYA